MGYYIVREIKETDDDNGGKEIGNYRTEKGANKAAYDILQKAEGTPIRASVSYVECSMTNWYSADDEMDMEDLKAQIS